MAKQSLKDKLKTSSLPHPLPNCAMRNLAGGADRAEVVDSSQSQTRDSYGEPVAMTNDSSTSYFGTNILGSVRSVTDKYGTVQSDYSYDAFGSPYLGNLENDIGFGYCGKVYDIGTGLYDYGFRDYSPVSARFTTIDPIRDGSNWFSYVVNNPVNYVDPFGLNPVSDLIDGAKEFYGKAKDGATKLGKSTKEALKSILKGTIISEPTYIENTSDIYVAGAIEKIPDDLARNPNPSDSEIKEVAWGLIAAPHGGRTKYEIDGSTIPVGERSEWRYDAVTDGNSIIISGNSKNGYSVSTKNMTKNLLILTPFPVLITTPGNVLSMLHSKKVTDSDFNSLSQPIKDWTQGNDLRAKVNSTAIDIAYNLNKQLTRQYSHSSGQFDSESNDITFSNINFNDSGNAYIGFNGFGGGCTK